MIDIACSSSFTGLLIVQLSRVIDVIRESTLAFRLLFGDYNTYAFTVDQVELCPIIDHLLPTHVMFFECQSQTLGNSSSRSRSSYHLSSMYADCLFGIVASWARYCIYLVKLLG